MSKSLMTHHHQWLIIYDISSSMVHHADGGPSSLAQHLWLFIIDGASSLMRLGSSLMSTSLMKFHGQWCLIINGISSMALHHRWFIIVDEALSLMGPPYRWGFLIGGLSYVCVDIPMYISIKSNAAAATTELNKPRGPLIKNDVTCNNHFQITFPKWLYMPLLLKVKDL